MLCNPTHLYLSVTLSLPLSLDSFQLYIKEVTHIPPACQWIHLASCLVSNIPLSPTLHQLSLTETNWFSNTHKHIQTHTGAKPHTHT